MNVKKLLKIILIALLVFIIILGLFAVYVIYSFLEKPTVYEKANDYAECLESEYYQNNIKHFPKAIPDNAQEVNLYCLPSHFEHDGALILLKMKVDKEYIKAELNNHKFLNSKTPVGTVQKIYHMPSETTVGIDRNELTYYVIDDKYNYNEGQEYFPYFTGIGVDKNYEYILYYYISPD